MLQDTTNSLTESNRDLTPGVRVESASFTDEGPYATVKCPTTAGVVLRNPNGQVRVLVRFPSV